MQTTPETASRPAEPRVFAAIVAVAALLFVGSCAVLHHGFYRRDQLPDTPRYQVYGAAIVKGLVPYRDYRIEYPPGALPVFVLPAIGHSQSREYPGYSGIFEWMMALCGAVVILFMGLTLRTLGATPRRLAAALGFVALSPLALGSVTLGRYDLYAAIFAAAGLAAFVAGRSRTGSVVLAIGTATKLYPALFLPLALVDVWRRDGRREALRCLAIFVGVVAAIIVPFVAVSPGGMLWMLEQQVTRPLQIESLGSAALIAAHHAFGLGVTVVTSHGSQNLTGGLANTIAAVQSALLVVALIGLWIAYARGPSRPERLVRYAAAAVCAYVALGKVLSPQYLIWLVALVPLVRGRRGLIGSILLGFSLILTQIWFPFRYLDLARRLELHVSLLVLDRDLVLVALLAVLLWPIGRFRPRRSAAFQA